MTLGWNYLNDIATQRFAESPSIEGGQNLHEITERARAEISRRAYPLLAVTLVSMLIFAGNLFCAAWELVDLEEYEHFIYGVFGRFSAYIFPTFQNLLVCVIIGTSSFLMIYLMQHREPFKSWFALSKSRYPETLESLFDDLQNETWQAKNNEGRLPVYLFSSAWRTLLAAGPEAKFLQALVWDKSGKAALRHALNNGQIQTLWLSDNRKPDPHASIEKMLGDSKTHKYTKTRIKTFEVLGISLG
jgi:hypothetical protein